MAKSGSLKIKLSKNMKPYVGRVSRKGPVQEAFKEMVKASGLKGCMASLKGQVGVFSGAQIHAKAKACTAGLKDKQLSGNFIHNGPGARIERLKRAAGQRTATA